MWPTGWMKASELQTLLMPETKDKEAKKSANEHKMSSKPQHSTQNAASVLSLNVEAMKDGAILPAASVTTSHHAEKRKAHATKEASKMAKHSHDKATSSKANKKNNYHSATAAAATVAPTGTTAPLPYGDTYSSKSVRHFFSCPFFI